MEEEVKKSGIPFTILERVWDDVWGGMFDDPDEDDYYKPDGRREELVISLGCPLIAYIGLKSHGIAKNQFRRVIGFGDGVVELDDGGIYEEDFIYKNFLSAYCITTHKAQGDTYKDKYTIHEWDKFSEGRKFNRRLRYVAQSRSTDPSNNIVYKN